MPVPDSETTSAAETSAPGELSELNRRGYWRANLRLMAWLLALWFVASYGLGILLVEPLNRIHMGGFPLGFWFAHQGSIYVFIVIVFIYARAMDKLDRRFGVE